MYNKFDKDSVLAEIEAHNKAHDKPSWYAMFGLYDGFRCVLCGYYVFYFWRD